MAAASPHSPKGDAGHGDSTLIASSRVHTTGPDTAWASAGDAELAAGCALSHGFALLHHQLTGLPTTLRAVLDYAKRGKVATIVSPATAARVTTVTQKLSCVPPLLAEWQLSPSLPTAEVLCVQARHLFADVAFTRLFLRTQSRAFHNGVVAGTTALPAVLIQATQRAIAAAEDQIRDSCHRLVESHLYMVQFMAQAYQLLGIPAHDIQDLVQDGCLGLLAAANASMYAPGRVFGPTRCIGSAKR